MTVLPGKTTRGRSWRGQAPRSPVSPQLATAQTLGRREAVSLDCPIWTSCQLESKPMTMRQLGGSARLSTGLHGVARLAPRYGPTCQRANPVYLCIDASGEVVRICRDEGRW